MTIDADRARKMLGTPALSEAVARALGWKHLTRDQGPNGMACWYREHAEHGTDDFAFEVEYATVSEYATDYWRLCGEMWNALPRTKGECWTHTDSIDYHEVGRVSEPTHWTEAPTLRDALILALAEAGLLKEGDMLHQHSPRPPFQKRR